MDSTTVYTCPVVIPPAVSAEDLSFYEVQLVGYDATATPPFWIVKNSQGTSWGNLGFGKISMDATTDCGIRRTVVYIDFEHNTLAFLAILSVILAMIL